MGVHVQPAEFGVYQHLKRCLHSPAHFWLLADRHSHRSSFRFKMGSFRPFIPGIDEYQSLILITGVGDRILSGILQPCLVSFRVAASEDSAAIFSSCCIVPAGG